MAPEEMGIIYLCIVAFLFVIIALAIGYGYGYVDGQASTKLWTKEEINEKLNQN